MNPPSGIRMKMKTITDEDRARWKERERLEKIAEEAYRDWETYSKIGRAHV